LPFSAILEDIIFENFFSNKIRLKNIGKLEVCFTFFPINIFCDKKNIWQKLKSKINTMCQISTTKKSEFSSSFQFLNVDFPFWIQKWNFDLKSVQASIQSKPQFKLT